MSTLLSKRTSGIIIGTLLVLNIIQLIAFSARGRELIAAQNALTSTQENKAILSFQKLFVDKVLAANGQVDYNSRRALDEAVGSTNNKPVIDAWNAFVSTKTEADAQVQVKNLLTVMADQVYAQ